VSSTNFVNGGLVNGTTYYYVVSALNFIGEGDNSSQASATPFPPQPPVAPTILSATGGNNLVVLSWTAPASAISYNVKSSTTSGGPYTVTNNVTTTSFVDNSAVNGTTYYYVASALNIYGEGPNSSETNATPAPVPPMTPTGLTASAGDSQVSLSWAAAPGATGYNVYSATTSGGPYTVVTNVAGTSAVNTGLVNDTDYYFVVTATNVYGESTNSSEMTATPFATPVLVFSAENRGTNFPAPSLPTLANLPNIKPLPDPFAWTTDPLDINGTRSVRYQDWSHHRAEILAQLQNYEIGTKPVATNLSITASYSGSTLTINITNTSNGQGMTLTCAVSLPSGSGPFPAIIGMNSPNGSVNASILTSVAKITFSHNQVTTYGSPSTSDPFFRLYPAQNPDNTGQYAAWAWGVSRIIDGLYYIANNANNLPIDLNHIGVTGCSYAGKMALFCGAFDERIALTIAQESGGGGANSWRYNHYVEPAGSVEDIDNTDYNWFENSMSQFSGDNVAKLPEDHHMLCALVAPRALFATGNDGQVWLGTPSTYVCCLAVEKIYGTFGISDRFGFNIIGNHAHCATTASIDNEMAAFVNRFLLSSNNVNTLIRDYPTNNGVMVNNYGTIPAASWTSWWGTTNAVLGP
jgi:hypothetical protein